MDDEQLDAEHILKSQVPKLRHTFEGALDAGFADPVVLLFNLELDASRESAIKVIGEQLRAQFAGQRDGRSTDATPSCSIAVNRDELIDWLKARSGPPDVQSFLTTQPDREKSIAVLIFHGEDIYVFELERHGH